MKYMKKVEDIILADWRPYAWIIFLAVSVYAVSLSFDFTFLDDNEFILENYGFIRDISNAGRAFTQTIFSNNFVPYYRPILSLSFMLDAQTGGVALFTYHFTNIALHAGVACLLFLLVLRLTKNRSAALVYSSIFCVHPVLTQAVAWIPGRNDMLLGLFVLSSLLALLQYLSSGSFLSYLSSVIFFGLALFTKESAIALPALFIIFLLFKREDPKIRRGWISLAAGWGASIGFWYFMRSAALIFTYDKSTLGGMAGAVVKSAPAFVQYSGKVLLPFNLSVFPTIRDTGLLYGIISILAVTALFIFSRPRNRQLIVFGGAWFILFLTFSFIRPSPECVLDFQEHRLYVPMIGFVVMLTGMGVLTGVDLKRPAPLIAWLSVVALFSWLTIRHQMDFRDKWAFWNNAVRTAPNAAFVHLRYGFICHTSGLPDKAEAAYKRALALDPELPAAHTKLGLLYMDKKMYNEAGAEFREEVRISPKYDTAYMCMGVALYKQGRPDEAVKLWKRAMRVNPYSVDARKNLAIYYKEIGDGARAACYAGQLADMGIPVPEGFLKDIQE